MTADITMNALVNGYNHGMDETTQILSLNISVPHFDGCHKFCSWYTLKVIYNKPKKEA